MTTVRIQIITASIIYPPGPNAIRPDRSRASVGRNTNRTARPFLSGECFFYHTSRRNANSTIRQELFTPQLLPPHATAAAFPHSIPITPPTSQCPPPVLGSSPGFGWPVAAPPSGG